MEVLRFILVLVAIFLHYSDTLEKPKPEPIFWMQQVELCSNTTENGSVTVEYLKGGVSMFSGWFDLQHGPYDDITKEATFYRCRFRGDTECEVLLTYRRDLCELFANPQFAGSFNNGFQPPLHCPLEGVIRFYNVSYDAEKVAELLKTQGEEDFLEATLVWINNPTNERIICLYTEGKLTTVREDQ